MVMKTTKRFASITGFIILVLSITNAQTTHQVEVKNYSFTPSNLTIQAGDMVTWNNTQGTHNVNGNKSTFSGNPESFGNNVASAPWQYSFTFTIAGTYNYHCDPHASFMTGSITVEPATPVFDAKVNGDYISAITPNPFENNFNVILNSDLEITPKLELNIFNLSGKLVEHKAFNSSELKIETSDWPSSVYIYQLIKGGEVLYSGKLVKQ